MNNYFKNLWFKFWLKYIDQGYKRYQNKHMQYDYVVTQTELAKYSSRMLQELADKLHMDKTKTLDSGVYFDNLEPYVIVDCARYNLNDQVKPYPGKNDIVKLGTFILSGEFVITELRTVLDNPSNYRVVVIDRKRKDGFIV